MHIDGGINVKKDELKQIVANLINIEESEILYDTQLSSFGFDSIRLVDFIVAIEEKYNIEICDSDLLYENFDSINSIYNTLLKYLSEKPTYKCIITDCDGVLWKGISGEGGIDEAHYEETSIRFCNLLHDLRMKGVMIAICSKNEEKNILAMLESDNTELVAEDFVIIQTGIKNKVESVTDIINTLGVYQNSVIFVDDSDYELGLISMFIPEIKIVRVTHIIVDEITTLFKNLPNEFNIDRTTQFKQQKEREKVHLKFQSCVEYNNALNTMIICKKAEVGDIPRMVELSQRANRFNINGKRYTNTELLSKFNDQKFSLYILKASDVYGDMGLVAIAAVCEYEIESFMLSCRAFGRDFEFKLIEEIKKDTNCTLHGKYIPTGKND